MTVEMEDLIPASGNCLSVVEEEEEFYERIEAPKFVDFTIPDRRADDSTWFCARIGCDQNHEVVDPDELYRSFVLRVLAARSPYKRFQRALNKQSSREYAKCPQSAPSKSVKDAISRMSAMNSVPEKMAMAKLKRHPITSLREAPIQSKARVPTMVCEKTQTTPRNNSSQAKYLKEPATVVESKNNNMKKNLFLHTPKRKGALDKTPLSESCSEMKKKLNIDSERKGTHQGSYATSSENCKGSSVASKKIKATGSRNYCRKILNEAAQNEFRNVETGGEDNNIDLVGSDLDGLIKPSKHEVHYTDLNSFNGVVSEVKIVSSVTKDDDKENILFTCEKRNTRSKVANLKTESSLLVTLKNQTPEVHQFHGTKVKRTTSPKPFRLRTHERGILKEANMERRLQVEAKTKSALLNHVDEIQIDKHSRSKLVGLPEMKLAIINPQPRKRLQPRNTKGKMLRRSRNKSFKIASPKQPLKLASAAAKARREPTNTWLNQDKRDMAINFELKQGVYVETNSILQRRKPATVPKEPKFQDIHVPKNCSKRFQMNIS